MRCADAADMRDRAQQALVREERVTPEQNSRKEKAENRGKARFAEQQGTPRPSVPRQAQISCCRESLHAAAGTGLGENEVGSGQR